MPLDERKREILKAVTPLLIDRGVSVSSKELAEAAGIAEGTLFRAFGNKEAIVEAATQAAFDPTPIEEKLAALPENLTVEEAVLEISKIMQAQLQELAALMMAIGRGKMRGGPHPPAEFHGRGEREERGDHDGRGGHRAAMKKTRDENNERIQAAVAKVMERYAGQLRQSPARAASVIQMTNFMSSMTRSHVFGPNFGREPTELVDLVLHGLLK